MGACGETLGWSSLRHGALTIGGLLVGLRHGAVCTPPSAQGPSECGCLTLTWGREIPHLVSGSRSAAIDDS